MGMAITHAVASGIGGMRTSGDLVARMQMTKGMKIKEAREYVANKLGITSVELADEAIMRELREELNIGIIHELDGYPKGIEAKFHIARLLGIDIKSVNNFLQRSGL